MWHTQTNKRASPTVKIHKQSGTSLKQLLQELDYLGMAYTNSVKGITIGVTKEFEPCKNLCGNFFSQILYLSKMYCLPGVKTMLSKDGKSVAL